MLKGVLSMLSWQNRQLWFTVSVFILSILIGGFGAYTYINNSEIRSLLMIGTIGTITFAGLSGGTIPALFITLICLFLFGTYSLIQAWNESIISANQFFQNELLPIIIWFVIAVSVAMIAGQSINRLMNIVKENNHWRGRYDELVQIDLDTSFDNDKRFALVIEEEFKRTKRYGGDLSLLLIEFQYYEQFIELYGEKEARQVVKQMANQIRETVRISDRKFRLSSSCFAVILTSTPLDDTIVVLEKVNALITDVVLSDKKHQISLTFHYGMAGFEQKFDSWTEFVAHAENDLSSTYTS